MSRGFFIGRPRRRPECVAVKTSDGVCAPTGQQKQTVRRSKLVTNKATAMSALTPKAYICSALAHVRGHHAAQSITSSARASSRVLGQNFGVAFTTDFGVEIPAILFRHSKRPWSTFAASIRRPQPFW
jgi:hypothetical protein